MINNPSAAPSAQTTRVARAIWAAMQTQSANNAKNFITKLTKEETAAALESGTDIAEFAVGVGRGGRVKIACYVFKNTHSLSLPPPQGMDVALFKEAYEDQKFDFLLSHAAYCRDVLKLKKGQTAVISNGRVSHGRAMPDKYSLKKKKTIHLPINQTLLLHTRQWFIQPFIYSFIYFYFFQIIGPLEQDEVFNQDDFLLLESIIFKTSADLIKSKINTMGIEEDRWVSTLWEVWRNAFSGCL